MIIRITEGAVMRSFLKFRSAFSDSPVFRVAVGSGPLFRHIDAYGEGNERRLTGAHETAPITASAIASCKRDESDVMCDSGRTLQRLHGAFFNQIHDFQSAVTVATAVI